MCPQRIATITWCQGLYVPVILEAVLSGAKTLGGVSQGKLVPGEGARLRVIQWPNMKWPRRSCSTSPRKGKLGPPPGIRIGREACRQMSGDQTLCPGAWLGTVWKKYMKLPSCGPTAGIGIRVGCFASWTAGKGGDLGVLTPGIENWSFWRGSLNGEETGAGVGVGAVPTRYSWAAP